jgi:hypothetical protein
MWRKIDQGGSPLAKLLVVLAPERKETRSIGVLTVILMSAYYYMARHDL